MTGGLKFKTYRNTNSKHKGGAVHQQDQRGPRAPAQHGVFVQVLGLAEDADEEEFCRRVGVEGAGDQEVGDCDPVGGFAPFGGQAGEGWAGDGRADVAVHDCGEDDCWIEKGGC
jgi:hypothetical protein